MALRTRRSRSSMIPIVAGQVRSDQVPSWGPTETCNPRLRRATQPTTGHRRTGSPLSHSRGRSLRRRTHGPAIGCLDGFSDRASVCLCLLIAPFDRDLVTLARRRNTDLYGRTCCHPGLEPIGSRRLPSRRTSWPMFFTATPLGIAAISRGCPIPMRPTYGATPTRRY